MLKEQTIYLGHIIDEDEDESEDIVTIEVCIDGKESMESRNFVKEFTSNLKTKYCIIRILLEPGIQVVSIEDSEYAKEFWEMEMKKISEGWRDLANLWTNSKLFDDRVEMNSEAIRQFEIEKVKSKYVGEESGY